MDSRWRDKRRKSDEMGWIRRLKVGLVADRIRSASHEEHATSELRGARRWLFRQIPLADGWEAQRLVQTYPPDVLRSLAGALGRREIWRVPHQRKLDARLSRVKAACEFLLEGERPPILRARFLADYIAYGVGNGDGVVRLARSLFSKAACPESVGVSNEALRLLRRAQTPTDIALEAIDEIIASLADLPWVEQVENLLKRGVFAWPLLVLGDHAVACSLPVAIDVEWEDDANRGVKLVVPSEVSDLLRVDWECSLRAATREAKRAWRSKHGGSGERLKHAVDRAHVRFDFQWACQVVSSPLPGAQLFDRSAEAYFSQVVLARFLGRLRGISAAVTGVIGDRVTREDHSKAMDSYVEWPDAEGQDGVTKKMQYAFRTACFDRVVLPHPPEGWEAPVGNSDAGLFEGSPVQIRYGRKLSNIADAVQLEGWRQYRYIREDELQWWVHTVPKQQDHLSRDAAGQDWWRETLRNGDESVLTVECHDHAYAARTLAGCLFSLNLTMRRRAPWISWLVIRMVPDEQGLRFFKTLYRACGAGEHAWLPFRSSVDWESAAQNLAHMLNQFNESIGSPAHRAPDIIVLDGYDASDDIYPDTPLCETFLIPEILARVGRYLRGPADSKHRPFVGRTRLVLLAQHGYLKHWSERKFEFAMRRPPHDADDGRIPGDVLPVLHRLSVFRSGFSHVGAALLLRGLRIGGQESLYMLDDLVDKGFLAEGQGRYFVPTSVHRRLEPSKMDSSALTRAHLAAGISFAPYFGEVSLTAIPSEEAFLPWNVNEASWHFGEARGLAQERRDRWCQAVCRRALRLIDLFYEEASWENVERLLMSRNAAKEAHERSLFLMEQRRLSRSAVHPRWLIHVGDACAQRAKDLFGAEVADRLKERETLLLAAESYYEQAILAAEESVFSKEADFHRIHSRCVLAIFLIQSRRDDEGAHDRAMSLIREARSVADASRNPELVRVIAGEVWEFLGDECRDYQGACEFYASGCRYAPDWHQLWAKHLGALMMAGKTEEAKEVAIQVASEPKTLPKSLLGAKRTIKLLQHGRASESDVRGFERMCRGYEAIRTTDVARRFSEDIDAVLAAKESMERPLTPADRRV